MAGKYYPWDWLIDWSVLMKQGNKWQSLEQYHAIKYYTLHSTQHNNAQRRGEVQNTRNYTIYKVQTFFEENVCIHI